jgi:hypothetical protein
MLLYSAVGGAVLTSANMLLSENREIYRQTTEKSYWTSYKLANRLGNYRTHKLQCPKWLFSLETNQKRNFIWWSYTEKLIQLGQHYQSVMYKHQALHGSWAIVKMFWLLYHQFPMDSRLGGLQSQPGCGIKRNILNPVRIWSQLVLPIATNATLYALE